MNNNCSKEIENLNFSNLLQNKNLSEVNSPLVDSKIKINLSNPTNLTNPLLVIKKKSSKLLSTEESSSNLEQRLKNINNNRISICSDNDRRILSSSKSETSLINSRNIYSSNRLKQAYSNVNIFQEKSLINSNDNILSLRKQKYNLNSFRNIKNKKIIYSNNDYHSNSLIIRNQISLNDNKTDLNTIWEKVKNSKFFSPVEKKKRIDIRKFIPKYNYIKEVKELKLRDYDLKIKNERYKRMKELEISDHKTLDNTIQKLQNYKDSILKAFEEQYTTYVHNLNRQSEKEKINTMSIITEKCNIKKEINILETKINKLMDEKNNLIRWLYFQISLKEKIIHLPFYYKEIIENDVNLDNINKKLDKKNLLSEKNYLKIKNYKKIPVFKDIDEFYQNLSELENKTVFDFNNELKISNEVEELKNELENEDKLNKNEINENTISKCKDEAQKNIMINMFKKLEMEKMLIKELNKVKLHNNNLNIEYLNIKKYKYLIEDKKTDKEIYIFQSKPIINMEKNSITYENFPHTLFDAAKALYYLISQNHFKNAKNTVIIDCFYGKEKVILDILVYADLITTLLFNEKKECYKDEMLKEKYQMFEDENEKKNKVRNFNKQIKLQKNLAEEKTKKIGRKINKVYYKPYKPIDYEHYRKEKVKKKLKKQEIENRNRLKENDYEYFTYDD